MSRIVVEMKDGEDQGRVPERRGSRKGLVVKILLALLILLIIAGGAISAAGYFYWQNLRDSPQYSIALLVDAARNDDEERINELVEIDAVVEDFVPQVIEKAIERYGRGLPEEIIRKAEILAAPIIPAVKQRARAELPALLKEKTGMFDNVPFWGLAMGADRYLVIETSGDSALVKGRMQERPLELHMRKNGGVWKIVAVRDEELAGRIAEKIGQELIFIAAQAGKKNLEDAGKDLGIDGIEELLKQAEEIFK